MATPMTPEEQASEESAAQVHVIEHGGADVSPRYGVTPNQGSVTVEVVPEHDWAASVDEWETLVQLAW